MQAQTGLQLNSKLTPSGAGQPSEMRMDISDERMHISSGDDQADQPVNINSALSATGPVIRRHKLVWR